MTCPPARSGSSFGSVEALAGRADPFVAPLLDRLAVSLAEWRRARADDRCRVVDLGCGSGDLADALGEDGMWVVGIDIDGPRLAAARGAHPGLCLVRADSAALPFRDGGLDVVVSVSTLQYADASRVLAECRRVLGPGGVARLVENLAGNPVVGLFRVVRGRAGDRLAVGVDADLVPRAHLRLDDLRGELGRFRRPRVTPFHLLTPLVAPLWFPVRRRGRVARAAATALPWLARVDRVLLGRWPRLGRFAWLALVEAER